MVLQKAVKSYPLLKWFLLASGIIAVGGLLMSGILTDSAADNRSLFIGAIVAAILLPFVALAFPRRDVIQLELPSDHLASASRKELQGMLDSLEEGKRKGDIPADRYAKARDRIVAAMKGKK